MSELRVVDFGDVTALRSQTLWHALCKSAGESGKVTLSFMRPNTPYVGVGLLRNLDEIDAEYCATERLPIIRRQVGGGPVYLDQHQLFFQVCAPTRSLPRSRHDAITKILSPFVRAFKAAGIPAELDNRGEISTNGSKVCGHGAGEIGDGAAVVGNLIEHFDYSRASSILKTNSHALTAEIESLMRRHVGSIDTQIGSDAFISTAVDSLSEAFCLQPVEGELEPKEWELVGEFDSLLSDPTWTALGEFGPPPLPEVRIIKIRAGVYVVFQGIRKPFFFMSSVFGIVESFVMEDCESNEKLAGLDVHSAVKVLQGHGYISDREFNYLRNSEIIREATAECPN